MARRPNTPFTGASPAAIDLIGTMIHFLDDHRRAVCRSMTKALLTTLGILCGRSHLRLVTRPGEFWDQAMAIRIYTRYTSRPGNMHALHGCSHSGSFMVHHSPRFGDEYHLGRHRCRWSCVGSRTWIPIDAIGFRDSLRLSRALYFALISASSAALSWEVQAQARVDVENSTRLGPRDGILKISLIDRCVANHADSPLKRSVEYSRLLRITLPSSSLPHMRAPWATAARLEQTSSP